MPAHRAQSGGFQVAAVVAVAFGISAIIIAVLCAVAIREYGAIRDATAQRDAAMAQRDQLQRDLATAQQSVATLRDGIDAANRQAAVAEKNAQLTNLRARQSAEDASGVAYQRRIAPAGSGPEAMNQWFKELL